MSPPLLHAMRLLTLLALIVTITWMIIRPGFDALVGILTTTTTLLSLIRVDKQHTSNSLTQHNKVTNLPASTLRQPTRNSYDPPQYHSDTREKVPLEISKKAVNWAFRIFIVLSTVIGYISTVQNGAISGIIGAATGAVLGAIVGGSIIGALESILDLIITVSEALWATLSFWIGLGILIAIGYLISGKL